MEIQPLAKTQTSSIKQDQLQALSTYTKKDVENRVVLLRLDLNIPMKNDLVLDESRIHAALPTLKDLIKKKAKIIILSHFGRPKLDSSPDSSKDHSSISSLSLKPIASLLASNLDHDVTFCDACIGDTAQNAIGALKPSEILLLENLRFEAGETSNDSKFAKALAELGDVYINDAFAVSHRSHASITGIPKHLPSYAGLRLRDEIHMLSECMTVKSHPIMSIVGGSKISTKLDLLKNLIPHSRFLVVGGGIANTLLKAKGHSVGHSLVEEAFLDQAKELLSYAKTNRCELILPIDVRVSRDLDPQSEVHAVLVNDINPSESIFDLGPKTIEKICSSMEKAKTLIWNGPVGLFEHKPFDRGSNQIAQCAAYLSTHGRLKSLAGGGETVALIKSAHAGDDFSYLSTGGGAFLDFLTAGTLPGLTPLYTSKES